MADFTTTSNESLRSILNSTISEIDRNNETLKRIQATIDEAIAKEDYVTSRAETERYSTISNTQTQLITQRQQLQSEIDNRKAQQDAATSKTAADAVNKNTDGTGKDSSTDPTKETLSNEEKKNIEDSNKGTEPSTSVVPDNKTSTGQPPSTANEEAKQGLFANAQYDQSGQSTDTKIEVGNDPTFTEALKDYVAAKISPNPLHAYATYTYSLSLHLLTPEAYNKLAQAEDWLPDAKTLIAGGGRWGTDKSDKGTFHRAAQFKDDFYFDGLSLDTIIGMNQQSRGANAITFKFNIIEPYGFTLVDRLLELSIEMNQPNYLTNPYVLQIDFFGNNDAGEPMHPCTDNQGRSMTKYLPCKITEMKIKVGTSGTTYACVAVPYNHGAFAETVGVTPANFEVVANTVGNFFTNDVEDTALIKQAETRLKETKEAVREQQEAERINGNNPFASPDQKVKLAEQAKKIDATAKAPFKAKSYTGAYNAYQQYLVNNEFCEHPVFIKFVIDEEIAKSKIVLPDTNSPASTPAIDKSNQQEVSQQLAGNKTSTESTPAVAAVKNDVARFNVNAGDQILELINKVMRNSSYITDQLKNNEIQKDEEGNDVDKDGKPLKWFKIIPQLRLTNFDAKRNDWGSEVTYHIVTYQYHNSKHPAVSTSDNNEIRRSLRKKYSYIYSGENTDILDFSLDFNTVFYTAVNVLTENATRLVASPTGLPVAAKKGDQKESVPQKQTTKTSHPNVIQPIAGDLSASSGLNAVGNPAAQRAADVMKSIYSSARGDMINVKLKIVGDPDFIKTDDVYYNPGNPDYPGPGETNAPDGSILTDRGDVFAFVSWRTPTDLDQETGFPDFKRYQNSSFDGVFKIIKVTCEFKNGGFEQSIEMIRFHDGINDILSSLGNSVRGQPSNNANTALVLENKVPEKDLTTGGSGGVIRAGVTNNTENTDPDAKENAKKADVAENGDTKTAEQKAAEDSTAKDGTNPNNKEPQKPQVQPDTGGKVDPATKARDTSAESAAKQNLPPGVTVDDLGRLTYRGITFTVVSAADRDKVISAIDNGTSVTVKRFNGDAYVDTVFDGKTVSPKSKDSDVAALQDEYDKAKSSVWNAQRRLNNANNGMFDDDPAKKQHVIDSNTKQLNDANAQMAAIEAKLKDKGAAPR